MLEKTYRQTHMLTYVELCHSWSKKLLLRWYIQWEGHPWWHSGKESACKAREVGLLSGSGRSSGERSSNPLQYSCMGNPMDRGAWQATVHGVAKESDMTWRVNNNNTDWFLMLTQTCISGICPAWSWCIILFMCCYIFLYPIYIHKWYWFVVFFLVLRLVLVSEQY